MNNSKLIDLLNNNLPEQYRLFKLSEAFFDSKKTLNVVLLIKAEDYNSKVNEVAINLVKKKLEEIIKEEIVLDFKKTISEEKYIVSEVNNFFYIFHPILSSRISPEHVQIHLEKDKIKVELLCSKEEISYIHTSEIISKLKTHLEKIIFESIDVLLTEVEKVNFIRKKKSQFFDSSERDRIRFVNIEQRQALQGAIARVPIYIIDALKQLGGSTVCGVVNKYRKANRKKDDKIYFSFFLNDGTGGIKCIFLPRKKNVEKMDEMVQDGSEVVVEGDIRNSSDGSKVIFVSAISTCVIDYSTINMSSPVKGVSPDYYVVFPKPYFEEKQNGFFETTKVPEMLKGKIVVFDLETTGLSPVNDRIIEIGAVKMIDGNLVETFETFVNPGRGVSIPIQASSINNIYDEDVKTAPLFGEVISDFFKFTHKCVLAAHNASFDMGMLSYHAREFSYQFDNSVIDTLKLSRELLKKNSGLTLDSLKKKFDIDSGPSHRALSDALATAKILIELLQRV